jgi:transcription initiation factor TFIID TATA-box-binding protein
MYTNIVCTSDLGCVIDLRLLTMTNRNIRYSPSIFNAAIWQHPCIRGTCMIFANGKICVNGNAKTLTESRIRVRRYARIVQKRGWSVHLKPIKIVTMSAYYRIDGMLSMNDMVKYMGATYEPELFPAAMLRRAGVHFTCFHNGKILITGLRDESMLEDVAMPTLIELEMLGTSHVQSV